jgi:hypothetical protein
MAAVRLIREQLSVNVRQHLVMNVPIVTQLVTQIASERRGTIRRCRGFELPVIPRPRGRIEQKETARPGAYAFDHGSPDRRRHRGEVGLTITAPV